MSDKIILTIQVLSQKYFPMDKLKKLLSDDKRKFVEDIQKLINLNKTAFKFLEIEAQGAYDDNSVYSLRLISSKYSGVIPIRSAKNGLICGHLKIIGRYGEDINEILPLLKNDDFTPEFDDSIPIEIEEAIAPPKYIECAKYIDKYEQAERFHWQKFSSRTIIQTRPRNTNWTKYSLELHNPNNATKYPNKINELTTNHYEWRTLQYVLTIAIKELRSTKTPTHLKLHYRNTINRLEQGFDKKNLIPVDQIPIHSSNPIIIRELKSIANLILGDRSNAKFAWRIDYAQFFERYVQHLFRQLAHKIGATIINNPHFRISGQKPIWALKHLEPDLIMTKENFQVVVDAKYKSHMYNWDSNSDELHDSFRKDFHQVLAYSSFSSAQNKKTIIIYPYKDFKYYSTVTDSNLNECKNQTLLIGIPISKVKISEVVNMLYEII